MHDTVLEQITLRKGRANQILTERADFNFCFAPRERKIESVGHMMCHFLYQKLQDGLRFSYHYHPRDDKDSLDDLRRILRAVKISRGRIYNFYQANPYNLLTHEMGELYALERQSENEELAEMLLKFEIDLVSVPFLNTHAVNYSQFVLSSFVEHADKFNVVVQNDVVQILSTEPRNSIVIESFDLNCY